MRTDRRISDLRIPEIEQALTPGQPLTAIINPSGELVVRSGSIIELGVTINNNGNQSALIDVYIDEASGPIYQWCASPYERLGLGVGQGSEIIFKIQVPAETLPNSYNYTLIIDAPQSYPEDTPIFYKGRLTVLPFVQEARTANDPTFTLQPIANSAAPIPIQSGETVELLALAHNRSDRVDLFRLIVTDLPNQWYRVIYPENFSQVGAIVAASGLELNPGDKGQIQILLTPPADAEAGIYAPTMRLYSVNNPELVLLDTTYIQVLPIYLLDIQLLTLIGRVSDRSGVFELRLYNSGNTPRHLILNAKSADEEEHCTYQLEPDRVKIFPKQTAVVKLLVYPPNKKLRRPFFGRFFNFVVEVEDVEQLPLPIDRFNGTLRWKSRPWWHFLLLLLLIVGAVGGLGFLIWWLLTRPPVRPEIVEFYPNSNFYEAARGDIVRLNWQINNPQKLQSIKIQGVSPEGVVNSRDTIYDFSQGIPNPLRNFCTIERSLICQNVPTDARNPDKYIFELSIQPKKGKLFSASSKTNVLQISAIPLPKILEFNSTQPIYQEIAGTLPQLTNLSPTVNNDRIRLNWQISNADRIQELRLIGRNAEGIVTSPEKRYNLRYSTIDRALLGFCTTNNQQQILVCKNVPTDARSAGNYIFELIAVPSQGQNEILESKKTDPIKINPLIIPSRIVQFQVNGSNALPKYQIQINPSKPTLFTFDWQVEGGKNMKVAILPAPGLVQRTGRLLYPIRQEPGTETVTLQATNEAGETVSRSVIIEAFLPPPPPPSPPAIVATPATPNASQEKPPAPVLPPPPKTGVAKPPKVASPSPTPPAREAPMPPPTATAPSRLPVVVPPPTATAPSTPPVVVPPPTATAPSTPPVVVPPPTATAPSIPPVVVPVPAATAPPAPPVVVPVPPPTASTTSSPGASPTPVGTNLNEPLAPAELPPQLKMKTSIKKQLLLTTLVTIILLRFSPIAVAKQNENIKILLETKECPECDLRGASLSGYELRGANLKGADLRGAKLTGSKLESANLEGAKLEKTELDNARLRAANLKGATLQQSSLIGANLFETDLENANLQQALLESANLTKANLQMANLSTAMLKQASLKEANLAGANLQNANLELADLEGANLNNANLENAQLFRTNLQATTINEQTILDNKWRLLWQALYQDKSKDLAGRDLAGADLSKMNLQGVNLAGANLEGAYLFMVNLRGANLTGTNLNNVYLNYGDLGNANLNNAYLNGANLKNVNLEGANLAGATLDISNLQQAFICGATMPDGKTNTCQ